MIASLVLGNGESRRNIPWSNLQYDIIIGCNAIHRDHVVDHLICCDRRMAEEAVNNNLNNNTLIYVRERNYHYFRKIRKNKNIKILPELPYHGDLKADKPDHWGSGAYALLLAAVLSDQIFLVGFDLYGINDKVNNVYKNTVNYSKHTSNSVDYSYWVYQIAKIFRYYPNKQFTILNDKTWILPNEWRINNVLLKNFDDIFIDFKYLYS